MYRIIYEPEAENDLIEILSYYAETGGMSLADAINQRMRRHIDRLKAMPQRIADSQIVPDAKGFLIEKLPYWAYFVIDDARQEVLILNIIHTRRKFPNL